MDYVVVQGNDYRGEVGLALNSNPPLYTYSLWRTRSNEHLFDGVAGDIEEAVQSVRAYIDHFSSSALSLSGSTPCP
jgi:hypothetical protein